MVINILRHIPCINDKEWSFYIHGVINQHFIHGHCESAKCIYLPMDYAWRKEREKYSRFAEDEN